MHEGRQGNTGLVFFPAFDWAISPIHPEREERLLYTRDQLFEEGLMDLPGIAEFRPRLAEFKDIARAHFCVPTVSSQVTEAHLIAAGGALVLADALMHKEVRNGFALVRPPGHHAMKVVHGNRGFCNINNEAIMVEYLRSRYGLRKIAIVDTDVHHGDGTQDIFWHDPDVLFISFHQDGRTLYPGSGFPGELGGPGAYARTLNIPLPPGTGDEGIHYVMEKLILPILKDFQPELVINSAGQDNHYTDPLARMQVTAQGYARLTEMLKPDLAVLEGGYAVETALPYVNLAIILAMAGLDYSRVVEPDYRPEKFRQPAQITSQIQRIVEELGQIWEQRDSIDIEKTFGQGPCFQRQKRIFYDTDYIREFQLEKVYLCPRCPGYLVIESSAEDGYGPRDRILGISLFHRSCPECQRKAVELYREILEQEAFDRVYLQDRANDRYWGEDYEQD